MLEKYVYDALRTRVMFGRGMALDTPHEIDASGTSRWLIVASDGVCRREADLIQRRCGIVLVAQGDAFKADIA